MEQTRPTNVGGYTIVPIALLSQVLAFYSVSAPRVCVARSSLRDEAARREHDAIPRKVPSLQDLVDAPCDHLGLKG